MSSYVYMKILESQPRRYDRGIAWLSWGQATRIRERLVRDLVRPGRHLLDIGCGTGTFAVLAAQVGAHVTAFDVSAPMLAVAREKIAAAAVQDRVTLIEMGVAGMDRLAPASFDLVVSTLAFSELSVDEQDYALHQAYRLVRAGGRLALADEVAPTTLGKQLLHHLVRAPLAAVTFAVTQTTTRAAVGLPDRVRQAGFVVQTEERRRLDSFLYLVARKDGPA